MPNMSQIATFFCSLSTGKCACQTQKGLAIWGSGSRSLYSNRLDCVAWLLLQAHNCLFHTQTRPLCSHYCQPDAVQSPLTCSFSLISFFPLSFCPLLFSLLLLSDGFNFGAAADADGEQAERVCGQPEGDRPPAQDKRGDLNMAASGRSHQSIKGKMVMPPRS